MRFCLMDAIPHNTPARTDYFSHSSNQFVGLTNEHGEGSPGGACNVPTLVKPAKAGMAGAALDSVLNKVYT